MSSSHSVIPVAEEGKGVAQDQPPRSKEKTATSTTKEKETVLSPTTLFISTLPYDATSEHLTQFFSAIGPVKAAFVVADEKCPGKNKGFGYVRFALPADAEKALKDLKRAKFMGKRTLDIRFAVRKAIIRHGSGDGGKTKEEAIASVRPVKAVRKQTRLLAPSSEALKARLTTPSTGSCMIQVSGLCSSISKKQLYKKARKFGECTVIDVSTPTAKAEDEEDEKVPGATVSASIRYTTPADAAYAVKHLDAHCFKGVRIQAQIMSDEVKELKKHRLIVRNLSFQCTVPDLIAAFETYGAVKECTVPTKPDGKACGFGFLLLESAQAAQSAMEGLNGKRIKGRVVAIDYALPKTTFERLMHGEDVQENKKEIDAVPVLDTEIVAANDADLMMNDDAEIMNEDGMFSDGESDGIKWAIDTQPDTYAESDDSEQYTSDEEDDPMEVEGVLSEPKKPFPSLQTKESKVEPVTNDKEGARKSKTSPVVPAGPTWKADVSEGCTLFVRNLPFELEEDAFAAIFEPFGSLRYARIVKDKESGISKGTGFVCYMDRENADACLSAHSDAASSQIMITDSNAMPLGVRGNKKDRSKPTSIIAPEPANAAYDSPFMLDGRFLDVTVAISKEESREISQSSSLARRASDKRCLYLLKEGVIFPESTAAKSLTPQELNKITNSYTERKKLLASNPNLFLSRTRLSIRNLGLKVDDKLLKRTARIAVKKFWDNAAAGLTESLETEVLSEEAKTHPDAPPPSASRPVLIRQAKIVRSKDRIDAETKLPRSKGYGFVEFESHADALACLRWMNNNPMAFGYYNGPPKTPEELSKMNVSNRKPVVEFAIDNMLIVKKRLQMQKSKLSRSAAGKKGEDEDGKKRSSAAAGREEGVKREDHKKRKSRDDRKGSDAGDRKRKRPDSEPESSDKKRRTPPARTSSGKSAMEKKSFVGGKRAMPSRTQSSRGKEGGRPRFAKKSSGNTRSV